MNWIKRIFRGRKTKFKYRTVVIGGTGSHYDLAKTIDWHLSHEDSEVAGFSLTSHGLNGKQDAILIIKTTTNQ